MNPAAASLLFVAACFAGTMVYAFACDHAAPRKRTTTEDEPHER